MPSPGESLRYVLESMPSCGSGFAGGMKRRSTTDLSNTSWQIPNMRDRFNAKNCRIEVQIELQEELPAQCKEI